MQFLMQLWAPILVSSVLVFVASSILWMATPLHRKDYGDPPDQDGLREALTRGGFRAGMYFIPWRKTGTSGDQDPRFKEHLAQGPWATLMVAGRPPSYARTLGLWFMNCLVISAAVAYAGASAMRLGVGAPEYMEVFRVIATVAGLAHGGMAAHDTMWRGLGWRFAGVKIVDAVIYGLLTGGAFGWLWPRGEVF